MKNKVLIGVGVLAVVVAGLVIYLGRNLNGIVENVIEGQGTAAVGAQVSVDFVDIDLGQGTATVGGFRVANPPGFSDQEMLRIDQLEVVLDLPSLRSEVPRITSIAAINPFLHYEMRGGATNLDTVMQRFPAEEAPAGEEVGQRVAIGAIDISGIEGRLEADRLPRPVVVSLGDVKLANLEGTPEEIAQQIMRPLIAQLSRNAAAALIAATGELLQEDLSAESEEALRQLRGDAQERLGEVEERVDDVLDDVLGDELRGGVGDLLRGNAR